MMLVVWRGFSCVSNKHRLDRRRCQHLRVLVKSCVARAAVRAILEIGKPNEKECFLGVLALCVYLWS